MVIMVIGMTVFPKEEVHILRRRHWGQLHNSWHPCCRVSLSNWWVLIWTSALHKIASMMMVPGQIVKEGGDGLWLWLWNDHQRTAMPLLPESLIFPPRDRRVLLPQRTQVCSLHKSLRVMKLFLMNTGKEINNQTRMAKISFVHLVVDACGAGSRSWM